MAADINQSSYFAWPNKEMAEPPSSSTGVARSQMLAQGSISFGRFESESLSWEKWSVFTHDRRQEEMEQFNGLVAEKKAYFEEYYKRMRILKALQQQEQHEMPMPPPQPLPEQHQPAPLPPPQQNLQTELSLEYSDGSNSSQGGEERDAVAVVEEEVIGAEHCQGQKSNCSDSLEIVGQEENEENVGDTADVNIKDGHLVVCQIRNSDGDRVEPTDTAANSGKSGNRVPKFQDVKKPPPPPPPKIAGRNSIPKLMLNRTARPDSRHSSERAKLLPERGRQLPAADRSKHSSVRESTPAVIALRSSTDKRANPSGPRPVTVPSSDKSMTLSGGKCAREAGAAVITPRLKATDLAMKSSSLNLPSRQRPGSSQGISRIPPPAVRKVAEGMRAPQQQHGGGNTRITAPMSRTGITTARSQGQALSLSTGEPPRSTSRLRASATAPELPLPASRPWATNTTSEPPRPVSRPRAIATTPCEPLRPVSRPRASTAKWEPPQPASRPRASTTIQELPRPVSRQRASTTVQELPRPVSRQRARTTIQELPRPVSRHRASATSLEPTRPVSRHQARTTQELPRPMSRPRASATGHELTRAVSQPEVAATARELQRPGSLQGISSGTLHQKPNTKLPRWH